MGTMWAASFGLSAATSDVVSIFVASSLEAIAKLDGDYLDRYKKGLGHNTIDGITG